MCRSIKTLRRADPPVDADEVRAAALQYVRKLSGYRVPSQRNRQGFEEAVEAVAAASRQLLLGLGVGITATPAPAVVVSRPGVH